MDTSESMKSDTPQPSAKEPSPQKEQADNNVAGMFSPITLTLSRLLILSTVQKQKIHLTSLNQHAFEYVFDCV